MKSDNSLLESQIINNCFVFLCTGFFFFVQTKTDKDVCYYAIELVILVYMDLSGVSRNYSKPVWSETIKWWYLGSKSWILICRGGFILSLYHMHTLISEFS